MKKYVFNQFYGSLDTFSTNLYLLGHKQYCKKTPCHPNDIHSFKIICRIYQWECQYHKSNTVLRSLFYLKWTSVICSCFIFLFYSGYYTSMRIIPQLCLYILASVHGIVYITLIKSKQEKTY